MASLREVRVKIKSVRQTQKVTKAMKMISAARFKKAQGALLSSRPYAVKVEELVGRLSARLATEPGALPPLLRPRPQAPDRLLVAFTTDRGLCGSYNVLALKSALDYAKEGSASGGKIHWFAVGKKGHQFLNAHGFLVAAYYVNFMRQPTYAQAGILTREILAYYESHPEVGEAGVLYTDFKSLLRQSPAIRRLLPPVVPAGAESSAGASFDYLYEPDRSKILSELLPRYATTEVFRMMFEAYTSEQAARMNVMENATRNAGELIEDLTLLSNQIRQAAITREILEVVSGAEALA
jgi:F-type H+-transporting ATPase subunit gamma